MRRRCAGFFLVLALLSVPVWEAAAFTVPEKEMPVPQTASPELQEMIRAGYFPWWNTHPANAEEWKNFTNERALAGREALDKLKAELQVSTVPRMLGNVPVYIIKPAEIDPKNSNRVLLYLHGGGYVLGPGESGTAEAVLLAAKARMEIYAPDYRLAPEHPFPAALEDALSVYKELLHKYPAANIGIFGTSAGGGLVLSLLLKARKEGLPMPGAIAPGTPWSDLDKIGDSYFGNENIDNVLVSHDGWIKDAAKAYAGERDLKDPLLSPVYGDFSAFPPALLTSGTRDLFLSNTVRTHQKMREANVPADLLVIEGLSHAQYAMNPDAPETQFYLNELAKFFDRYLGH